MPSGRSPKPAYGPAYGEERARWLAAHVMPHEPALRAWLGRRAYLGIDVDDIIQETYTILVGKACVRAIRDPRAYTVQTAYSVMVRHLRQTRVTPIDAMGELAALNTATDAPSPEAVTSARQQLRLIQDAIAALPRQTRQAFVLRRVEGLSQQEIARRMRLSESTVEKHVARGLRALSRHFGRTGEGADGS